MSRNPRRWLLTRESLPILLLQMAVSASGELRKIQECYNSVDKLWAHTVFVMYDMSYDCYVRFSDGHMR